MKRIFCTLALMASIELRSDYAIFQDLVRAASNEASRYRIIDKKVEDLKPVFEYYGSSFGTSKSHEWFLILGKVTQVLKDGLLVRTVDTQHLREPERSLFLVNHPDQREMVDGESVAVIAKRVGRKTYTNTQGAATTVELYDFGELPTNKQKLEIVEKQDAEQKKKAQEINARLDAYYAEQKRKSDAARKAAFEKAFSFHLGRAANGDAFSQYELGMKFLKGEGTATNEAKALEWLQKSAAQDYGPAKKQLEKMGK